MTQEAFMKNRELFLANNNNKAANELYKGLRHLGMAVLSDSKVSMEDKEDVVATSLAIAFKNLAYYTDKYKYNTWFGIIVKRRHIDLIRKQKAKRFQITKSIDSFFTNDNNESEAIAIADNCDCPLMRMNNDHLYTLLNGRIAAIKDARKRDIIKMSLLDGKGNDEIIKELNLNKNMVNVTIHRFKESVKEYFGNWRNFNKLIL